ncbi:MAG: 30S ribosomal protein S3 [Patescibacteria group bacterium]
MTHTVHPYSHRLGIIRDWKSRWFGKKGQYQNFLQADIALREFLGKKLRGFYVVTVDIERDENEIRLIIKTSRPGMVIGRNGDGVTKLKGDIQKILKKNNDVTKTVKLDIEEVKDPESHAAIVAYMVAEGLEKRMPFRRVMKQVLEKSMAQSRVEGVKISVSGRLGGADMSRKEMVKDGRIPLQTLRADIDFAREKAFTTYGVIGVKVWIYRGEIFDKEDK